MNERLRNLKIPFGKHIGKPVCEIPLDYLNWLANNCELREPLASAVQQELAWSRPGQASSTPPIGIPSETVDAWYRALAIEFHPDHRGGSTLGMTAVNRSYELLMEMTQNMT